MRHRLSDVLRQLCPVLMFALAACEQIVFVDVKVCEWRNAPVGARSRILFDQIEAEEIETTPLTGVFVVAVPLNRSETRPTKAQWGLRDLYVTREDGEFVLPVDDGEAGQFSCFLKATKEGFYGAEGIFNYVENAPASMPNPSILILLVRTRE